MLDPTGLEQRSRLLQAVRTFFHDREYVEVDTPIRLPVLIPEAHIQPIFSEKFFLQTSPEMCMKMLLARGCTKLFQLCHCFRKEERGRFHHSEFTMLEWYRVGSDYLDLMDECEALLSDLVIRNPGLEGVKGKKAIIRQGREVSLEGPWSRLSVTEAFATLGQINVADALASDCYEQVLVESIEPFLGWERPVFLYDYPIELASLARPKRVDPELAERFELYIGGVEIANGFSELVDPVEQRRRFLQEIEVIEKQGRGAAMPEQFLDSLERIEDCAGIALGLDRLVMLLMGKDSLEQILPFPG